MLRRLDLMKNPPPARTTAPARAQRRLHATTIVAIVLSLFISYLPAGRVRVAEAAPCDPPVTNPIACENTKIGNPASEWDIGGAGDSSIQGFATDISVNKGQTVHFKISTTATAYRIDLYRLGYYGGMGARKVATVPNTATLKQNQPACLTDSTTGLVDCGNWAESASWAAPIDAVSGVYIARLVRESGVAGASHIAFVVRDDAGQSDLLFQTSDTTWQAYNGYGGNSLYTGSPDGRAYKVSYNRPFTTRGGGGGGGPEDWIFNAEYPMIRFLERNGYNVSYATDVDTDRLGSANLLKHKAFLSVGHDEYWSGTQRANVEAARAAGVHLAFFSGNESFWKTRWENAIDGSATPYRTLVTYKETHANAKIDPLPTVWTGTWRDPRFSPPADGGRPENGLSGTMFTVQGTSAPIGVPSADGKMRFWRNTSVATLPSAQTASIGVDTIGYEWDEDLDNGFRPAGLIRLASSTLSVTQKLQDNGSTYAAGSATHAMTLYKHSSGALVFGAGTIQYAWGLDDDHDRSPGTTSDARLQQATVNLFADMGVQPGTLQAGLVAATASADTTAPSSAITSPAAGASIPQNSAVTISGTATDTGGQVGGVEVSTDGGATWHRATGRASWSYSWTATTAGSITLKSRATDDSGNTETPGAGVTITVTSTDTTPPTISAVQATAITTTGATITWTTNEAADTQVEYGTTTAYGSTTTLAPALVTSHSQALAGLTASTLYHYRVKSRDGAGNLTTSADATFTTAAAASCSCSIWSGTATPAIANQTDPNAVEVGVKFRANQAGQITGIRFYKGSLNTGTHVGSLWSSTGTLLGRATFAGETASGWQQVSFATPVA
ncbi:MAG TPA: N,N-dimethylformamidase beta subunit family domain-containing protein, partial [Chloroflexota bacterium]|nr:N,N-dimethylformamidase beta subunit family domain-containing protein [Chloroflexota bacterium]